MKLSERLDKDTKKKLNDINKRKKKPKKKKRNVERFSERDILDLMGVGRQTYKRNRGAIKRK